MKKLKDRPLSLQIWIVFTLVIVIIFGLLSIYFSLTIRRFFTDEVYRSIETAQEDVIKRNAGSTSSQETAAEAAESNDIKEVRHIRMNYSNDEANLAKIEKLIPNKNAAQLFLRKLKNQVDNQKSTTGEYMQRAATGRVLYVIRINDKKGNFMVSYMWDTYRNSLAASMMRRLFSVMIIALIISLAAAKYLAQRLVGPLRQLQSRVRMIGKKQWHEEISIDREDEIGELSRSIEEMRKELVIQDEYEQTMLQQASHDLKTPLMVIRSYAQAVEDGIYPKGDLQSTMKVIDSEAERMQKRIKNLLYLTKIKYMSKRQKEFKKIYIRNLVESVVDNFTYNERKVRFELDIRDIEVVGDEEQWAVVFENIIDNELRYAETLIRITVQEDSKFQYITIYNDGEKIPEDKLKSIFVAFSKDKGGNFGLGLDIVKRIVNMYGGSIEARNNEKGVSFIIKLCRNG
ncbi:MAG: ATP-binding protein, partial [Bacillota bacterium]|nr:ATP-binding protein [Bacillota bacterium]